MSGFVPTSGSGRSGFCLHAPDEETEAQTHDRGYTVSLNSHLLWFSQRGRLGVWGLPGLWGDGRSHAPAPLWKGRARKSKGGNRRAPWEQQRGHQREGRAVGGVRWGIRWPSMKQAADETPVGSGQGDSEGLGRRDRWKAMAWGCTTVSHRDGKVQAAFQAAAMMPVTPNTGPPALSATGNRNLCIRLAHELVPNLEKSPFFAPTDWGWSGGKDGLRALFPWFFCCLFSQHLFFQLCQALKP